jgi:site-specific recombinase XerD
MKSQKTQKPIELPLYNLFKVEGSESRPERIAQKYLQTHKSKFNNSEYYKREPFFKDVTNQHFNRELKVLTERARIKKRVTAHVARHTFGTIMATKVKPTVLKEMMQHSGVNTTMIYIHLSKSLLDEELDKIDW